MRGSRITIAGIMTAVVFAAIDALLLRYAEYFAGSFLVAIALQVGFFPAIAGRGRGRRFWVGFEAAGLVALLASFPCLHDYFRYFVPWPFFLFGLINRSLAILPNDLYVWCLRHVAINLNGPLRVIDLIAVQEVSFGLPMVLLAAAIGLLTARFGSRRATRPGPE